MKEFEDHILDEASSWFLKVETGAMTDALWEQFIAWLEAEPSHKIAYDLVAQSDTGLEQLRSATKSQSEEDSAAVNDNGKWIVAAMSIAAVILLTVFIWPQSVAPDMQIFETEPGSTRQIALSNGTQVALNGGSQAEIDMTGERLVRLIDGEITLTVTQDAGDPITVEIDNIRLIDAGTEFNVTRERDNFTVSVSEGLVILNPNRQSIEIEPGYAVSGSVNDQSFEKVPVDIEGVGSWRDGRLLFNDEPLNSVAAALQRNLGANILVSPDVADVRFTGSISLDGDADDVMKRLEGLSGVRIERNGEGWKMGS